MTMHALICGSLAYDHIMVFHGRFKESILPEQTHILSLSFLVPELRREFGGCAGNIAYNLKLLADAPLIMGTVGSDFAAYDEWLEKHSLASPYIKRISECYTAQAFIMTDLDDNQITAFHPGAMMRAHENTITKTASIQIGILAPDGREGMLAHAEQYHTLGIPFIFDPGQGLPMFSAEELKTFVRLSHWVVVNDYEWQLLQKNSGLCLADVRALTEALIVTHGGRGSVIYTKTDEYAIAPTRISEICDPTGCGDAYRAGLLHALSRGMDWPTAGRLASVMGAIKAEKSGGQNHHATLTEIQNRFKDNYGYYP